MVPRPVLKKWERDADTFRTACLRSDVDRSRFRVRVADSGVEFLKALDDPEGQSASLILLSHGALHRKLSDRWVKLAVLQASIKGRHGVQGLRQRLARFGPMLLRYTSMPDAHFDLFFKLLNCHVSDWKGLLVEAEWFEEEEDDPVPAKVADALAGLDLEDVFLRVVEELPERTSEGLHDRIRRARKSLDNARDGAVALVWKATLRNMNLDLPLLILDEAHRVRHAHTQLASLLEEVREDLDTVGGQFAQAFDRMLFLTATPFQLGHRELHSVLSRFSAVRWDGVRAPKMGREAFLGAIDKLHAELNEMQIATDRLERAWKRLLNNDALEALERFGEAWWDVAEDPADPALLSVANERVRAVLIAFRTGRSAIAKAEQGLRPWVLRHVRPMYLPIVGDARPNQARTPRRERIEGGAVRTEVDGTAPAEGGLRISGDGCLPFFLAAWLPTLGGGETVFSDGIASSFEALLDTRKEDEEPGTDGTEATAKTPTRSDWYAKRLQSSARTLEARGYRSHPKLAATVDLAMSLWRRGEKVLIFNQYRRTGAALHRALSELMQEEIERLGTSRFGCGPEELLARIESLSRRWDKGEPSALAVERLLGEMFERQPGLFRVEGAPSTYLGNEGDTEEAVSLMSESEVRDAIHSIVLRFLRTPTFFLRYAPEDGEHEDYVRRCFELKDASGLTLRALVDQFLIFLSSRPSAANRQEYLRALLKIQTGTHAGKEVEDAYADDVSANSGRIRLAPNVRRVFGDTGDVTRQRIMLTFNTPFYPEILIASSVLAEGVDLHLNCRHIIHHDLEWNPSSLEQRTGRVDRLGAKAEQCGHPIRVYVPYLEGCQDEKLFRVVSERERWFGVVMGAEKSVEQILKATAWERERMAEQPAIPDALAKALTMSLGTSPDSTT